ncbi:pilus assembly protein [Acidiphilium sp. PA]|uniref:TadE/TadG family type IV pilus assembly protein n=1 Tax=Acidiphilium sp. PA TaxID=2871705 RepID=UPI0022437126|nr:TadE family protein [Acidiphilium sp. PA]MCW8307243.1 pilus assembly protein [Acidiphilium sp. PA]
MGERRSNDRVRLWACHAPLSADRRGAFALEFAMVGPIFLLALLFVFNVAYDLFTNEVLNNAVQATARQMQTGTAPAATSQAQFISNVVCPNTYGLIDCNNIYVRVEQIDTNTCSDFYDATTGTLPIAGGTLQLGDYGGAGSDIGPSQCATSSGATGFCNAGPNEAIMISVIYTAPSFMGQLLGTVVTYNGTSVTPLLATAGFETEGFAPLEASNPC